MCGIAGVVSSTRRELGPLLREMLHTLHHRGPDGAGYVIGSVCERKPELEALNFDGKKDTMALGHVRLAITGGRAGVQPFQSERGRLSLLHNGEIYNFRELAGELDGDYSVETGSDSEVLLRLIEKEYAGNLAEALQTVLPRLDGVYAIAVTDQRQTVIARDKIGVRQLYTYMGRGLAAYASEKKPLLALGGRDAQIHRLPPGHMMILTPDDAHLQSFWSPHRIGNDGHITDSEQAKEVYGQAITEAVRKRVHDRERVGIIFSGGVDSVLIAHLVKEMGIPLTCYTAGRGNGASDLYWARRTAEELDFPLKIKTLSTRDIDRMIPEVISDIEDNSLNQVEVAIPIFASVRMAQEEGERVILSGQGADELFGGYPWYPKIVDEEGYDEFVERSWEDTFLLYKECLEREDKIAMAHSMELRVPFLDPQVIDSAFSTAPELKIKDGSDSHGKRIHREYSRSIGIPEGIAFRPKEAAQHGANVHDAFEEIAESRGLTASLMDKVGYDPGKTVDEKLGSSSRYGFRYGEKELWEPQPHVQYYLDSHAAEQGLLPRLSEDHWNETRRKLAADGVYPDIGGDNDEN